MEGALITLQEEFTEASGKMKKPCGMRGSSFVVKQINGSPPTPYDYKVANVVIDSTKIASTGSTENLSYAYNGCNSLK